MSDLTPEERALLEGHHTRPTFGPALLMSMSRWRPMVEPRADDVEATGANVLPEREMANAIARRWREAGFETVTSGYVTVRDLFEPIYWVTWDGCDNAGRPCRCQAAHNDPDMLDPVSYL